MTRSLIALVWLASAAAAELPADAHHLLTCGAKEVVIVDVARSMKRVWTWTAAGSRGLPPEMAELYRTTDECKPVEGGRRVLVTSSSDGVALVDRSTGGVEFYATAANAHSAELLPGGRVAVAASHRAGGGDRLYVFDLKRSGQSVYDTELSHGHGVVWDEKRQILWALSGSDLRAYRLREWEGTTPGLLEVSRHPLPDGGGHDLYPVPGSPMLTVTTNARCWLFDRGRREFKPHPELGERAGVKSIAVNPLTGQTAFVQADRPDWWSETLRFLKPARAFRVAGERFYKARWLHGPEEPRK